MAVEGRSEAEDRVAMEIRSQERKKRKGSEGEVRAERLEVSKEAKTWVWE